MAERSGREVRKTCDVKLSKSLSWLLRHGAEKEGLTLDKGGFVDVSEVLHLKQFKTYAVSDIKRVVEHNDKQRFSLKEDPHSGQLKIRANQGHSISVSESELLTPLTSDDVPPLVYHGTYRKNLEKILKSGLHRMNRNHIHFTMALPSDSDVRVVSGMRTNCEVCIIVDTAAAIKCGIPFFKSENGVILSPGDSEGYIPPTCFKGVKNLH